MEKKHEDEAIELPLFSFGEAMIFRIPPATSSRGHMSQDWKQYFAWKGKVEVTMRGEKCKIAFRQPDNSLYGYGYITRNVDKHLEKCYDSLRFFALTLLNDKGQSLLMGIGFDDRNAAFDFMESLLKFKKNAGYDIKPTAPAVPAPKADFSLKQGEKLVLSFGEGESAAPRSAL